MNSSKAIALRSGSSTPAVRDIDREDLFVEFFRHHKGHIQRRQDRKDARRRAMIRAEEDRKDARRRAMIRAEEDRDQQMRDLALVSQFSALGVLVVMGLVL